VLVSIQLENNKNITVEWCPNINEGYGCPSKNSFRNVFSGYTLALNRDNNLIN